ncbi:MAG: erythronolide synthase, 3 and 4, partial [Pseudomonadota bacterium]
LAIAAADMDQLRQGLQAALDTLSSAAPTAAPQDQTPGWVFVFAGHGGQWLGMGRDLFDSEPVFRQMVERVAHCVREVAGWDLLARWFADQTEHSIFADTRYLQPAIFTMQVALTSLLRHYGVQCAAVIGHSLGEIAAAWAAGACELEQACRLVLLRSAIMADAGLEGRMVLVKAPLASWQERIAAAGLDLACINSAEEWVVSGSEAAIAAFSASLQASDTAHFALAGAWPFHSRHCTQAAQRLQAALQDWPDLRFKAGTAAFFSTVSGAQQDPGTLDAAYWADNLRQCVAFAPAVQAARAAGWNHFVEIGSHPVLLHAIKAGVADSVLTAVQRKQAGVASFYHGLAQLYSQGATLDFAAWFDQAGRSLNLPPYPFEKKRYWISAGNGALKPAQASPAATPAATPATTPAAVTAPGPAAEADSTLALALVRRLVQQALHHDGIDDERSFSALGLDSLMAMGLAKDLERTFGKAVVYKDIWLHGTARRLADFIDGRYERRGNPFARSWVTLGGAAAAPVKLLCLHCAGGNPAMFHEWARHLGQQVELLAVQLPGRGDLIEVDTPATLAELVQALLPGLVERLQGCHFHLLGHSLGALLAWELAQALAHSHGLLAQAVWLVGAAAPQTVGSRADFVAMAATNLPGLFPGYSVAMDDAVRQDLIALLLRDLALLDRYRYQHSKPLALPLLHFCAGDDTVLDHAMQQGWRELSADYRQIQVAGDHISMLHSHALLAQLQAHLGAAPQAI